MDFTNGDIVEKSSKTLRLLEQNDPILKRVSISNRDRITANPGECFWVHEGADLSRLGNAIANNTNLKQILFFKSSEWTSQLDTNAFIEGLKRNTTINHLWLSGGTGSEILNEFVVNNNNLTKISIHHGGGVGLILPRDFIQAITKCSNLTTLSIAWDMDDVSFKDIALGIRGLSSLQKLDLTCYSNIGIGSVKAIATLLHDPNCNINHLDIGNCGINDECIQIIVTILKAGNTKLGQLGLSGSIIGRSGCESIATLLQDRNSNINKIKLSQNEIDDNCATLPSF